jgi:hypothetical protein
VPHTNETTALPTNETTADPDDMDLFETPTHKAMAELTSWWVSLTGLYSEEAWEDMWAIFDRMKELGLAADILEKTQWPNK